MTELERFAISRPRAGVALIEMVRPERLNAMDQRWFAELTALAGDLGREETPFADIRAVVVTGTGRAFSAGGDIDMFAELAGDVTRVRPHLARVYAAFHAVETCVVPVIGAVNGIAFGGGAELALACDIVVAAKSARFSFKETTVGLMPGYGMVRGPEVMGRHWTRYLALTGRSVGPQVAQQAGLVQEVCADGELLDHALGIAEEIAAHAPLGSQVGKAFVNRGTHEGYAESVEAVALLFGTEAHAEAVRAFRAAHGR